MSLIILTSVCQSILGAGKLEQSNGSTRTLRMELADADIVLFGSVAKPKQTGDFTWTTELTVKRVIRDHRKVAGKKTVILNRNFSMEDQKEKTVLVFGYADRSSVGYFGEYPFNTRALEYLKGLMALDLKDRMKVLKYCEQFLDHPNPVVRTDVFNEHFVSTDEALAMAAHFQSPKKLRKLLASETDPSRLGVCAFLLGHCGAREDRKILWKLHRKLLKSDDKFHAGTILKGLIPLDKKRSLKQFQKVIAQPSEKYSKRFAWMVALNYFLTVKGKAIPSAEAAKMIWKLDKLPKYKDFPIRLFSNAKYYGHTEQILALPFDVKKEQRLARAIATYVVQCPLPEAQAFAEKLNKQYPKLIKETWEGIEWRKYNN